MDITWKTAYIWDLYVAKEYRNKGVGTALIENTIAYLKSIGIERVGLLVNYWNETPRSFLKNSALSLGAIF